MTVKMMTTGEYARLMGMHEHSVRRMCEQGRISCAKVGGRWRIAHEEPAAAGGARPADAQEVGAGELVAALSLAAESLAAACRAAAVALGSKGEQA